MTLERVHSLLVQARQRRDAGDWDAARRHLEEALRLQPAHEEARIALAQLLAEQGAAPKRSEPPGLPMRAELAGLPPVPARPRVVSGSEEDRWSLDDTLLRSPDVELSRVLNSRLGRRPSEASAEVPRDASGAPTVTFTDRRETPAEPPSPPAPAAVSILAEAQRLLDAGDPEAAVVHLEAGFLDAPSTPGLFAMLESARGVEREHLEARLGPLEHRPEVQGGSEVILGLELPPGAGFLLSQIDGTLSYEELFAVASMERVEAARILVHLLQERIIA